jgi:hypothetical protein
MEPGNNVGAQLVPPFRDRRTGLIVFGIIEILIGGLCALFIPLMLLGQAMAAKETGAESQLQFIIPALAIYGIAAIVLIVLGTGSIRTRRWARALSLIVAWSWLVIGTFAAVFMAIMFPRMLGQASPAGQDVPASARMIGMIIGLLVVAFFFVAVPAILVIFYQSKHVKATCEARDPIPGWTDRVPLPVLAVSLWLAFGAATMLFMPAAYHGVAPFFGVLISGLPGTIFFLAFCAIWFYCAWAIYQLKVVGWWLLLLTLIVGGLSNVLTFTRVDITEMYRLMGYSQAQLDQMQRYNYFKGGILIFGALIGFLPTLGFLLYVKKFLRKSANAKVVAA